MDSTTQTKPGPTTADLVKMACTAFKEAGEASTDPTTRAMVGLLSGLFESGMTKKDEKPAEPAKTTPTESTSSPCCAPPAPRQANSVNLLDEVLIAQVFGISAQKPVDPKKQLKQKVRKAFDFVFPDLVQADELATHFIASISMHEKTLWNGFKTELEAQTVLIFLFPEVEEAKLRKLLTLLVAPLL